MIKAYEFIANGTEEIEALTVVDVLRRAGVDIKTVSINDTEEVVMSHGTKMTCDLAFADADLSDADMLLLPGGLPGAYNLNDHEGLREALVNHAKAGKKYGAICAAPLVLGGLGLLEGKKATCYPGFERALKDAGATYTADLVTVDGNITTGEGPAAAFPYAYELLSQLMNKEVSEQIAEGMRFKHLMAR
jgi:4-methyl-5(b-hydroxyethyl)-thiazole monophosphate biosynthesis